MSPTIKLGLLALIGAAAATPHHGHQKYHKRHDGYAGPKGGWTVNNGTQPAAATGAPPAAPVAAPAAEDTSYLVETEYSTEFITKTVYAQRPSSAPAPVLPAAVNTDEPADVCEPSTVYVTATQRVTVTVPDHVPISSTPVPEVKTVQVVAVPVSEAAVVPSSNASAPVPVPSSEPAPAVSAVSPPVVSPPAVPAPASPSAPAASKPAEIPPVVPSPVAPAASAAPSNYNPAPVPSAVPVASSAAAPAASSAAPPTSGYTGGKRGLAYRWDGAADAKTFAGHNYGFAWNWESTTKGDIGNLNFIPTLRTPANEVDWLVNAKAAINNGANVVFGYNEPDMASQAAMDTSTLCQHWQEFMNPIKSQFPHVEVVGPSVTSSTDPNQGLSFLDTFKKTCPQAVMDSANIHWYGTPSDGVTAFKSHITEAIGKYGNIWVTEFTITGATEQQTADFLAEAQKFLDGQGGVKGYSFFAVGSFDPAFNMLGNANALTQVGKVYMANSS